jgi:hypothetical protein
VKIALLATALVWIAPAEAHSWYPRECCNDKDCHEADKVTKMPDGNVEVQVGSDILLVPSTMKRRRSQDQNFHVCYSKVNGAITVSCFFEPGLS